MKYLSKLMDKIAARVYHEADTVADELWTDSGTVRTNPWRATLWLVSILFAAGLIAIGLLGLLYYLNKWLWPWFAITILAYAVTTIVAKRLVVRGTPEPPEPQRDSSERTAVRNEAGEWTFYEEGD
jgi:hypothetical protein